MNLDPEVKMYDVESRVLHETPTLVMRARMTTAEMADFLAKAFHATHDVALTADAVAGPPFARYRRTGLGPHEIDVEAGFPTSRECSGDEEVVASKLPGGPAAVLWHVGAYGDMERAYQALQEWLEERGAVSDGAPWEIYYSNPDEEPDPSNWRTEIIQPYTV